MTVTIRKTVENKWLQELVVLLFTFILFSLNDWMLISSWNNLWKGCTYFFILYTHAQLNRIFLLPVLLEKGKPLTYALLSIGLVLMFSGILYEVATLWLYKNCYLYKSIKQQSYIYHLATMVATSICIMGPLLLLKYYREQRTTERETILAREVQLNALRSQLNPHFLFNTFNTLYGISLQYPDRVPDLIMQASQLMRYQLDSGNKKCVSLKDEISFIESYINLEKERVGHRCEVVFTQSVENPGQYKMPAMLLIAFVENAFKHGTCSVEQCYVHVSLKVENELFVMDVKNSVPRKKPEVVSTRIGIQNSRERLAILYPDRHRLDITEGPADFQVHLELKIDKYG
jgi:two-component system LytT family sensor kinase